MGTESRPHFFIAAKMVAALMMAGLASAAEPPPLFQPPGMWIWDNWFVQDGGRWHAFYLALPQAVGPGRRWKDNDPYKHVGHAVSTDLIHWQDRGPALCALPGTWNDRHIATGSILHHDGRWWMFFTGRGRQGDGVGLAVSDDLMAWKTQPRPLFPLADTFAKQGKPFESAWEGQAHQWVGISDPYVYPELVDGWFYLVLCSRVLNVPLEESGCLTLMRARDLHHWEPAGIMAWPRCFERMETPQLWRHEGRWHLSFGGVLNEPWAAQHPEAMPALMRGLHTHQNYVFTLADFLQPAGVAELHHIVGPKGGYIMKVLPMADGLDAALFTINDAKRGTSLSLPSRVHYQPDGGLELLPLDNAAPSP